MCVYYKVVCDSVCLIYIYILVLPACDLCKCALVYMPCCWSAVSAFILARMVASILGQVRHGLLCSCFGYWHHQKGYLYMSTIDKSLNFIIQNISISDCSPTCTVHQHVLFTNMYCSPTCTVHQHVLFTNMYCSPTLRIQWIAPCIIVNYTVSYLLIYFLWTYCFLLEIKTLLVLLLPSASNT